MARDPTWGDGGNSDSGLQKVRRWQGVAAWTAGGAGAGSVLFVERLGGHLAAARAPELHLEVVPGVGIERHQREAVLDDGALVGGGGAQFGRGHHAVLGERDAPDERHLRAPAL